MTAIPRSQLAALSDLVGRWTGLHFPEERYAELERGLVRAAHDFGHTSTTAFVNFCLTTAAMTPDQVQALAWHLTIGETYFLRGRQTFEVLERDVLPALIMERRKAEPHLRLWSAGCAGGEEPYSLAITVSRLLPDVERWNTTILATDINTRALNKASMGHYSNWSFRDTPDWLRPQFFTQTVDGEWAIRPDIRRRVTFSYLNLAADPYPSLATNTNAMDVIFCRNVLMYFSGETMRRVVERLYDALRDGGYLFVAPSEASQEFFPQFERVAANGEIYYRKVVSGRRRDARPVTPVQHHAAPAALRPSAAKRGASERPTPSRRRTTAERAAQQRQPAAGKAAPRAAAATAPADASALVAAARSAANEGRLNEALAACEQAIAIDKLSGDYRYLYATVLAELDRQDEAVKALNSALYLDPRFVLAHFLHGNISRRRARPAEAESHFRTTLALLEELSPDEILPESEGMTAGKLAEIVKSILQLEAVQ